MRIGDELCLVEKSRERQAALIQNWKPWECSTEPRTATEKATANGSAGARNRSPVLTMSLLVSSGQPL
jgi:hypothetical protein